MSVIEARVDQRLIHGQVVEGWVPMLAVQKIVVVADGLDADPTRRTIFELSVPPGVVLETWTPLQAVTHVEELNADSKRTLILFDQPQSAVPLVDSGLQLQQLTLGNLHYSEGKQQLAKTVAVDTHQVAALRHLCQNGVELNVCAGCRDTRQMVDAATLGGMC